MSRRALYHLWLTFGLYFLIGVGLDWDRGWHLTHVFADFFSPPHWFIYSMVALTTASVWQMTLSANIRAAFGEATIPVPFLKFKIPGALAFALASVTLLNLAGLMDLTWHTAFGLDETGYSFPHSMLAVSLDLTLASLFACRLALRQISPIWDITLLAGGWFLIHLPQSTFVREDPLNAQQVIGVSKLPVLANDVNFQHKTRITLAWHLYRQGNIFNLLLSTVAAGVGLSVVFNFLKKNLVYLLLVSLFITALPIITHLHKGQNPLVWLPLPFLPAAIMFSALYLFRLPAVWAWGLAGGVYGATFSLIWGAPAAAAVLAIPAGALGGYLGQKIYNLMDRPTYRGLVILFTSGICLDLVWGAIDLFMRFHTP